MQGRCLNVYVADGDCTGGRTFRILMTLNLMFTVFTKFDIMQASVYRYVGVI